MGRQRPAREAHDRRQLAVSFQRLDEIANQTASFLPVGGRWQAGRRRWLRPATVRHDETRLQVGDIKSDVRQRGYAASGAGLPDPPPPVAWPQAAGAAGDGIPAPGWPCAPGASACPRVRVSAGWQTPEAGAIVRRISTAAPASFAGVASAPCDAGALLAIAGYDAAEYRYGSATVRLLHHVVPRAR